MQKWVAFVVYDNRLDSGNKFSAAILAILALPALFLLAACDGGAAPRKGGCQPTPYEEIGPFYRPDAPVRNRVGRGYELVGEVLSAGDCRAVPAARIEFWLVNSEGHYDDEHRATVFADRKGRYRFESNRPTDYVGRKPHIHIMVAAAGHERLITQHYPRAGDSEGVFDLVLVPVESR